MLAQEKLRIPSVCMWLIFIAQCAYTQSWQSEMVHLDRQNRLIYATDSSGNRIPDFSYAGYKNRAVPIPGVPVVKTLSPLPGDNTDRIQRALDSVGALSLGSNGIRGALLLTAGSYEVWGTIYIRQSGVVLRGEGDGSDSTSGTIIRGRGNSPAQRTILVAGGGSTTKWSDQVSSTRTDVISDTVHVGDRRFRVNNPGPFKAGDNIILYHPCTQQWLQAIGYGGTHSGEPGSDSADVPWTVGSQPIVYNRHITAVSGDTITVDAPVFNHLVRSLSQSYIYKYGRKGVLTNIGIEDLRIDIETAGGTDEAHAWNAINLVQIEDGWVRNCTMLHFGHAGVITETAIRITIDGCKALDPVSIITGERRYNFDMSTASQLILVSNCRTSAGRHDYVSNGTSWTSGCVFLDCTSEGTNASSEGHRRWSTGLLFDNISYTAPEDDFVLGLYNRGYYGTSHGWGAAHSVAWNCSAVGQKIIIQKPPTAQNYAIGCKGTVTGVHPPAPFDEPQGYIEGSNQAGLSPRSLYIAQLQERLGGVVPVREGKAREERQPRPLELYQNYPNPFNLNSNVRYRLPALSISERQAGISEFRYVRLVVYDMLGREVATLVNEVKEPGTYTVEFSGGGGSHLASGVYWYRLALGDYMECRKMVVTK